MYVDASAIVKIVVTEPESQALAGYLEGHPSRTSSDLTYAEVVRAVRRESSEHTARARAVLERVTLVAVSLDIVRVAAMLDPPSLRTLDAIHLATALTLGAGLAAVVTYDARMIEGAESLGLRVASPA